MKYAIDTNILVRYLVQDDASQAQKANTLIEGLTSDNPAFISLIVLCELNWVLKIAYKVSKKNCIAAIRTILSIAVFEIEQHECCTRALHSYEVGKADFSDYLIIQIAKTKGCHALMTLDRKIKDSGF